MTSRYTYDFAPHDRTLLTDRAIMRRWTSYYPRRMRKTAVRSVRRFQKARRSR